MIKAGLRTQLDVESFVTGQLVINLDMHPGTPAVFRGHEHAVPRDSQHSQRHPADHAAGPVVPERHRAEGADRSRRRGPAERHQRLQPTRQLTGSEAGARGHQPSWSTRRETQELPATLAGAIAELRAATQDARALIGKTDQRLDAGAAARGARDGAARAHAARGRGGAEPRARLSSPAIRRPPNSLPRRCARWSAPRGRSGSWWITWSGSPSRVLRGKTNREERP